MSGTLLERLQQKVDAELEQYRSGLLSQGAQAVMDSAYELSVKSELAARVDCAFLDRRQLKGLLAQERPLQYVYDRWEPDHAVIGDLLAGTKTPEKAAVGIDVNCNAALEQGRAAND